MSEKPKTSKKRPVVTRKRKLLKESDVEDLVEKRDQKGGDAKVRPKQRNGDILEENDSSVKETDEPSDKKSKIMFVEDDSGQEEDDEEEDEDEEEEVEEDGGNENNSAKSRKRSRAKGKAKPGGRKGHACKKLVGGHVSSQGGAFNAVYAAAECGATSFALFLKSQRQWAAKPLDDKVVTKFKEACKEYNFKPKQIIPHGSYLLNCGSPSEEMWKKSRDALVEELQRCEKLGIAYYNFHPGSTCGQISVKQSISKIASAINFAHRKTKNVTVVIENMCCQGNTIGGKFEELRDIIEKVTDKERIGVCLDTCHAFAAGFDLVSEEGYKKFISDFKKIVGFKYLKALHLNDSKGKVGCHLDRHENIGKGYIGLAGFRRVMNDSHFNNIPMILETPHGVGYDKEIKLLHSLCKR